MAFQRELTAHHAQQLGDQAQLVGKGGIQQEVRCGFEALDIACFAVQHAVPHGKGLFRAAAAGGSIAQGAAAQADILCIDDSPAIDAVFLPQTGIHAVDIVAFHKAGELRVQGMDALHDAYTALQVDGLHLLRALLCREIIDWQHGLSGLAEFPQALLDERQVQCIGVFVIQRAVRQPGVELCPFEEIIQTDHLRRSPALLQSFCQTVGAGGLAAGRRAGEHDDLCAGELHLLGGIIHTLPVAPLAQICQHLRAAGRHIVQIDLNQTFRYPDRDHKNQPLLFCVPAPPQNAGYIHSDI